MDIGLAWAENRWKTMEITSGCGGIHSVELLYEVPGRQRQAPAGRLPALESDLVQLPGRFRGHGRLDLQYERSIRLFMVILSYSAYINEQH